MHSDVWPEISQSLSDSILENQTYAHKRKRQFELTGWPGAPTLWPAGYKYPPRPWLWVRAKVFYGAARSALPHRVPCFHYH